MTAISVPTGIVTFNIDGLTIHRMFQSCLVLPVTHESMAKYTHLSDMILKTLRDKLKTVELSINRWNIHEFECDIYVYQFTIVKSLIQMIVSLSENTFFFGDLL